MTKLTKSKERVKDLGEVFTPPELVEEMLDRIPKAMWSDHSKNFIDSACGNGNFLVAVMERKIRAGSSPLKALCTTFGIDIMEDNVRECRERLLKAAGHPHGGQAVVEHNILCGDSLKMLQDGKNPFAP